MRLVIADDEALLREGLTLVVQRAGFEVVAAVNGAQHLLEAVAALKPDVVITDIRMPPTHTDEGIRAAREILGGGTGTGVIVLSQHVNRQYALELLTTARTAGVGYLLKHRIAAVDEFIHAITRVAQGGSVLDPELVGDLLVHTTAGRTPARLTPRQREVLAHMAMGKSNAAIAAALHITEKAVVRHVSHLYDELGLAPSADDHRRVLAVLRYLAAQDGGS